MDSETLCTAVSDNTNSRAESTNLKNLILAHKTNIGQCYRQLTYAADKAMRVRLFETTRYIVGTRIAVQLECRIPVRSLT